MSKVNVDNLLGNLLGNLDKGVLSAKKPKVKKSVKLQDINKATYKLAKESLSPVKIVLLVNTHTCECCGNVYETPNKHVLVEKVDKHGNKHRTRFMTRTDIDTLPREIEFVEYITATCTECFSTGELTPVLDEEAMKVEQVLDLDAVIDKIFDKQEDEA